MVDGAAARALTFDIHGLHREQSRNTKGENDEKSGHTNTPVATQHICCSAAIRQGCYDKRGLRYGDAGYAMAIEGG